MISGAHMILYSKDAEADRAFLRDVLGFPSVDAGGGWLIFALPPAEMAVHPAGEEKHEIYFMCDDIERTAAELMARGTICTPPTDEGWGVLTQLTLPGGGKLGLYQPRHPIPSRSGLLP